MLDSDCQPKAFRGKLRAGNPAQFYLVIITVTQMKALLTMYHSAIKLLMIQTEDPTAAASHQKLIIGETQGDVNHPKQTKRVLAFIQQ